jgi:hypothetical protein
MATEYVRGEHIDGVAKFIAFQQKSDLERTYQGAQLSHNRERCR